jgi:aryl-alcohol dehydrogenase-like predicted oxidoreductase
MRYNPLGRTGFFVSEITLGTMTFGGAGSPWNMMGQLEQPDVDRLVARAIEAGVNFLDTADIYSEGQSEVLLGQALRNLGVRRSDVVIATKAYGLVGQGPNDRGASRGHIMDSIKGSLARLGTDYVDLYQIHALDRLTPIEETLRALDDLVRQGHVRYVGVSNWPAWQLMKGLGIAERRGYARIVSQQAYYTIASRDLEREIAPLLVEEGVGLMVWSPLAGGLLSGKRSSDGRAPEGTRRASFDFPPVDRDRASRCIDAMRPIATAHGVSIARVALAWLLHQPFVTSVIIGAKTIAQLDDNLAASTLALSADELAVLDQASALPREYPGWMVERQAGGRRPPPKGPDRN